MYPMNHPSLFTHEKTASPSHALSRSLGMTKDLAIIVAMANFCWAEWICKFGSTHSKYFVGFMCSKFRVPSLEAITSRDCTYTSQFRTYIVTDSNCAPLLAVRSHGAFHKIHTNCVRSTTQNESQGPFVFISVYRYTILSKHTHSRELTYPIW